MERRVGDCSKNSSFLCKSIPPELELTKRANHQSKSLLREQVRKIRALIFWSLVISARRIWPAGYARLTHCYTRAGYDYEVREGRDTGQRT